MRVGTNWLTWCTDEWGTPSTFPLFFKIGMLWYVVGYDSFVCQAWEEFDERVVVKGNVWMTCFRTSMDLHDVTWRDHYVLNNDCKLKFVGCCTVPYRTTDVYHGCISLFQTLSVLCVPYHDWRLEKSVGQEMAETTPDWCFLLSLKT